MRFSSWDELEEIFAFSTLNIWITTSDAKIIRSDDGGSTWYMYSEIPGFQGILQHEVINDVKVLESGSAWAIGGDKILKILFAPIP